MEILFSIVVPTYNRGHLLPALLESFTVQRYSNFELIVVDDGGSVDHQRAIGGDTAADAISRVA